MPCFAGGSCNNISHNYVIGYCDEFENFMVPNAISIYKPYWSNDLQLQWNVLCEADEFGLNATRMSDFKALYYREDKASFNFVTQTLKTVSAVEEYHCSPYLVNYMYMLIIIISVFSQCFSVFSLCVLTCRNC